MKNNNQKFSVGKTIKALRENKGLTQAQLAEKINVSDKAVSKWEKDGCNPDFDSLCTLAEFFNVTLDYLMIGKKTEVKTVTISKLELCAKEDSEKIFDELKKENKLSVTDENGKTLLDYVLKYESKAVFELICKNLSLNDFMCPRLVKMLLKSNFPVTSYGNALSKEDKKRCEIAGLDEYWFTKLKDDSFNNEVLDLILYNKRTSPTVKQTFMKICAPYRFKLFEGTAKRAIIKRDTDLLSKLSVILQEYNSVRKKEERYKPTKEILNSMLENGLFDFARKFDEGFDGLNERDYRLAELKFNNASKDIIRENEFILEGLLYVKDLLETKDLALIKRCIKKYHIHYLEYILDFYKSRNYKDLFALAMYLELNEIVDAIISDSGVKISNAVENLLSRISKGFTFYLDLGDNFKDTVKKDAFTPNLMWFFSYKADANEDDGLYYTYKDTRFTGVNNLKTLDEKVSFMEEKMREVKAEILAMAEKESE